MNIRNIQFQKTFSVKAEAAMLKSLAHYLAAQLPLNESLGLIETQIEHKRRKETVSLWRSSVEGGRTLAQAFETPDGLRVSMSTRQAAVLGEKSATLAESLRNAYVQLEKIIAIKKKVMLATSYPIVILLGAVGLISGLMLFVFPKIIPVFSTLKVKLPLSTRMLIYFSNLLAESWFIICASLAIIVSSFICLIKFYPPARKCFDFLYLRVPLVGYVVRTKVLCEAFDSLHVLLRSGEQLSDGFKHLSDTVRFHEYKNIFRQVGEQVTQGKNASQYFRVKHKLLPGYISGILSVGERTGNLEGSAKDLSDIARSDLDDRLHILTSTLEPILMIAMSIVIGFIALSIILPIYGVTSNFQNV